ncbi:MAG TPA: S-adenosylmethionine decarboxylase [Phycisphaerae bacterium]|nr:S-adenosylmethionine decarboxylase [Phycisphaerae bacterium]HPS53581.1 S-adenosylmethionine decarboxylase [Phycisphaerae bacterium]
MSCCSNNGTEVITHGQVPVGRNVVFGWELVLDLYDCDPAIMSSEKELRRFTLELCKVINMTPYGEPWTPYFGENCEHTKGYSLLQFIETSSITGHFSEGTKTAYINIFTCKAFDEKKAEEFTVKFFKARTHVSRFMTRA